MKDLLVIDADSHVSATQEMWDQYMEKKYWDLRPQTIVTNSGGTKTMMQDEVYPRSDSFAPGLPSQREYDTHREGGEDPKLRLKDMEDNGVDVSVCIPGLPQIDLINDIELASAMCRARNNHLHDYCSEDPARLRGVPPLPFQDIDACLAEMDRLGDKGWVAGIRLPANIRGKDFDDPYFEPIFERLERYNWPLIIHAGAGVSHIQHIAAAERLLNFFESILVTHPFEQMLAMMKLATGGVLERHPKLRVGHFESGSGWLHFWVERLDEYFNKVGKHAPKMVRPVSEYIEEGRIFFGMEEDDESGRAMWRELGWDHAILFAWDYPHFDATFDGVVDNVLARDDMTDDQKRKYLGGNAQNFYQFEDLPKAWREKKAA